MGSSGCSKLGVSNKEDCLGVVAGWLMECGSLSGGRYWVDYRETVIQLLKNNKVE
jgi:hypothetical protein